MKDKNLSKFHPYFKRYNLKTILNVVRTSFFIFDANYYRKISGTYVARLFPRFHFLWKGANQGLASNPFLADFDCKLNFFPNNEDHIFNLLYYSFRGSGHNPLVFQDLVYLNKYPDLANFEKPLLYHYYRFGKKEGRFFTDEMGAAITPLVLEITPSKEMPKLFLSVLKPIEKDNNLIFKQEICVNIHSNRQIFLTDSDNFENRLELEVRVQKLRFLNEAQLGEEPCHATVNYVRNVYEVNIYAVKNVLFDAQWIRDVVKRVNTSYPSTQSFRTEKIRLDIESVMNRIIKRLPEDYIPKDATFALSLSENFSNQRGTKTEILNYLSMERPSIYQVSNRMPLVLLVSHEDSFTGAPIYLAQIAELLRDTGNRVEVLCFREGYRAGVFTKRGFVTHYLEDLAVKQSKELIRDIWLITKEGEVLIRSFLNKLNPSQIWFNSLNSSSIVKCTVKSGIPTALFVHESFGFSGIANVPQGQYELEFARALNLSHLTIYGSEQSRNSFLYSDLRDNHLIMNSARTNQQETPKVDGADRHFLKSEFGFESDSFVILMIASFEKRKRIEDAIQGFIEANLPNAYLLLVGSLGNSDEYSKAVVELAKKHPQICIFNVTSELDKFYSVADIFLFTSEKETYPLVLQESSYYLLPRVVAKFPGYEECVNVNSAVLFEIGDINSISKLIRAIYLGEIDVKGISQVAKSDTDSKAKKFSTNIAGIQNYLEDFQVSTEVISS